MTELKIRDHVVSPAHGLDRVKLSCQRGPLGSFDRPDAERIAALWNAAEGLSTEQAVRTLECLREGAE